MKKLTPFTGETLEHIKTGIGLGRVMPGMVKRDPSDASIGTGDFTQGVPAFWFARAVEYGSAENLYTPYADSAWVRSAIQKISGPISSCEILFSKPTTLKVRRKGSNLKQLSTSRGIVYRAENELLDLPQLAAWLKEPVADHDYQDFVEASIGWLKMQECFWVMGDSSRLPFPDVAENPYSPVMIARPDKMRPTIEDGEIVRWTYIKSGGKTFQLDPAQIVRLRGWNPYDDYRGLGDYRAAHIAAEADWLAGKFSRNLMANNGDTSRIIAVKNGMPTDEQREQLTNAFKARREASMRGRSKDVVVGGDVELHNAELASVDASFVQQRIENRHEIYNAFGVPMSMADIKASYSIGSASDMFQLLINTCIPTGAKFCGALEKLIFKMTGERIEVGLNWDEHPCMQEVRKERLDSIAKLAAQGMPMEQINEYLALGLVKYPGWEVGYMPINIQPVLNEDGEVNPAPTPGDFSEPIDDDDGKGQGGDIDDGSDTPKDGDAPEVKAMFDALRQRSTPVQIRKPGSKQLWEAHMRLRSGAIKKYQGKASKLFNQYRGKALVNLAVAHTGKSISTDVTIKSLIDVIFNATQFGQDLKKAIDPVHRDVLQTAGDELFDEIGEPDDAWKMAPSTVTKFISGRDKLLAKVGETAQGQINTTLQEGIDKGETTDQLAGRVRSVFNSLTNNEAKRIAMTETSAAYGFARHTAMYDAGIQYKSWLTSHGPTVREAHAQAEDDYGSDPIPLDEPFVVDGENLMHPGDPEGSPRNVINCHCIEIAVRKPAGGDQ